MYYVCESDCTDCLGKNLAMRIDVYSNDADSEAAAFPSKAVDPIGFKLVYVQTAC